MSTAVAKMMRVPVRPQMAFMRDIERAREIHQAAIARAEADFVQRAKEAFEKHFAAGEVAQAESTVENSGAFQESS